MAEALGQVLQGGRQVRPVPRVPDVADGSGKLLVGGGQVTSKHRIQSGARQVETKTVRREAGGAVGTAGRGGHKRGGGALPQPAAGKCCHIWPSSERFRYRSSADCHWPASSSSSRASTTCSASARVVSAPAGGPARAVPAAVLLQPAGDIDTGSCGHRVAPSHRDLWTELK